MLFRGLHELGTPGESCCFDARDERRKKKEAKKWGMGMELSWSMACLVCTELWIQSLALRRRSVEEHACNSSTRDVEVEELGIQGHSLL